MFGQGGTDAPVYATRAGGGSPVALTATGGCKFTFDPPATAILVHNKKGSNKTAALYIGINVDVVTADTAHKVLSPGDSWDDVSLKNRYATLTICSESDMTLGTDFIVAGFVDGG